MASLSGQRAPHWSVADAERWLLSLELFGMRFGLDRMRRLMTALDTPHEAFRSIHVVGTNGKSSTVRMIAALLEQHGVRAGPTCRRTSSRSRSASASGIAICRQSSSRSPSRARSEQPSSSIARCKATTA